MPVVTISASYGAGGSEIAPRVAQRLGVPFIDRAIPVAVAQELGISVDEADAVAANAPSRLWKFFARMSTMSDGIAVPLLADQLIPDRELVEHTEAHLRDVANTDGCVVLGHAAAVVLVNQPAALHVRLDGDPQGRIAAAMRQHGIDQDAATLAQKQNDKLRAGYVRHFYQVDPDELGLYDLVLNTVRLDWSRAEDLVVTAAERAATP